MSPTHLLRVEEELALADETLISVRICEFYSPRKLLFDLHLRLGSGQYLRVFRAGENYEESELKAYESDRGVRTVWFAREHRTTYVTASLTLLQKITALPAIPMRTKFGVARILCELWLQELFEAGDDTRAAVLERGKEICAVVAAWAEAEKSLELFLLRLEQIDSNTEALGFLSGLFAAVFSQRFPWRSRRTTETLLLAGFVADLGLCALKPELRRLKPRRMTAPQRRVYEKHPEFTYLLLKETGAAGIPDVVMQVARESHEYCDGSGFPNKLMMSKILQLSKVLVLAGDIVTASSDFLLPPVDAIKVLFPHRSEKLYAENPEIASRYDRELLKTLFPVVNKMEQEAAA